MTDQNRRPDPIEREANQLTRLMDSGRHTEEVANALRQDSYNMNPRDFNQLVRIMQNCDNKDRGDNIEVDRHGNIVLDDGRRGMVVATRDWEEEQRYAREHHRHRDGRQLDNEDLQDAVVKGAVGAGIGAIIDGKKGAIAGGVGAVTSDVLGHIFKRRERE
jgi:hypothetical protein